LPTIMIRWVKKTQETINQLNSYNSTIALKLTEKIEALAKKEELEVQLRSEVQAAIEMKKETQRDLSK